MVKRNWKASAHIIYDGDLRIATVQSVGVEANRTAELIAAAPDLLAALENLEEFCSQVFAKPNENDELKFAHAAIAKAKGE